MKVNAIFFDLGGTLFSYGGGMSMGQAIVGTARDMGIEAKPAHIGKAWRSASEKVMRSYASKPYFLHRDLFDETLSEFARALDGTLDESLRARFITQQRDAVVDHLPLREECHHALQALKQRGLYLSIVSNIDDDYLEPLVVKHGLDQHLDHWTSSEEAQSCKPHPDIYHYCLKKAGSDASDTLFVGDSLHHDIAGASTAGLRSVRIVEDGIATPLTAGLTATAEPNWQIKQLTELINIVDELNG